MFDDYACNLGQCVNATHRRFFGKKSHDCHVFMEYLFPIVFRELWMAVSTRKGLNSAFKCFSNLKLK